MTKKTDELGSLQKKVLYFIAENPDRHKLQIQKGIGYRRERYGSVLNAVKVLESKGLIKTVKTETRRSIEVRYYSCTEEGVWYTLIKNPKADILKILDSYKNKYPSIMSLRQDYDKLGHERFMEFLRLEEKFLPIVRKLGLEEAFPFMLSITKKDLEAKGYGLEELKGLLKEMIDYSPRARKAVENLKKFLSEVSC